MTKFWTFDQYLIEKLHDLDEARSFLEVCIDEYKNDGDVQSFMHAMRLIAEAQDGIWLDIPAVFFLSLLAPKLITPSVSNLAHYSKKVWL